MTSGTESGRMKMMKEAFRGFQNQAVALVKRDIYGFTAFH
jgi:hypothetical protein